MLTIRRAAVPLGALLAALFLLATAGQVAVLVDVLPRMAELTAGDSPEMTRFDWTMVTVAVLGLLCVQVVLVATAKLLSLVARDRIFSADAMPWVDAIIWAIAAGWVLLLAALVPVFVVADLEDAPGLAALNLLLLLVGAAVGLLMIVMRELLRQATTLRSDMETVI